MSIALRSDPGTGIQGPECHDQGIRAYGNPDSKVVLLGIAPGRNEMTEGRPMVGPSGQVIDACLEVVGIDPTLPYRTNLICTWNNAPTPAELIACRPRLYQELDWINPKVVLCMGNIVQSQFGLHKRGYMYHKQNKDGTWAWWIYTYHPSAVLQGSTELGYDIARDFQKIPRALSLPCPPVRPAYEVIDNKRVAQNILNSYSPGQRVALDIETRLHDPNTDDLDIYTDSFRCLSLYDGTRIYVFTHDACQGLDWPTNIDWTLHNGSFDVSGIQRYLGPRLQVRRDTMLKSICTDEYTGSAKFKRQGLHKLENLVGEYFGDIDYKEATKKAWRAGLEPSDQDLYARNALDSYYTYHLDDVLEAHDPCPAYERLLLPGANAFGEMIDYGVYIDPDAIQELKDMWGPRYIELTVHIQDKVPNPRSWKQKSKYLYSPEDEGGLGLPGGPSTAKPIIKELGHPFTEALMELSEIRYRLNNWVYGIEPHIKPDGRIHPTVWFGLETYRRAWHKPAVQTIPKWGTNLQKIRRLFSAPDPSWAILEADYSQAEMWTGQFLSQDQNLLHDLTVPPPGKSKPDVHASTAVRLGSSRQVGKRCNFLMLFGGGGQKLHDTLLATEGIDIPVQDCMDIVKAWREVYSTFTAWADEQFAIAQDRGYLESPFGHYRRFPLPPDPSWRATIINWPIQCTAGSYTLDSAIALHHKLKPYDAHVLFDVHDSLVFQVRRSNLDEVAAIIKQTMESPKQGLTSTLPSISVDLTAGTNLEFTTKYALAAA